MKIIFATIVMLVFLLVLGFSINPAEAKTVGIQQIFLKCGDLPPFTFRYNAGHNKGTHLRLPNGSIEAQVGYDEFTNNDGNISSVITFEFGDVITVEPQTGYIGLQTSRGTRYDCEAM